MILKEFLIPKAPIFSLYPRFQEFQSCVSSCWRSGLKQIKTQKKISKNIRIILQISDTLEHKLLLYNFHQLFCTPKTSVFQLPKKMVRIPTVDGWNPAPPRMMIIPLFIGFYTSQVVQDFFHQQYVFQALMFFVFFLHLFYDQNLGFAPNW